ncbi:MAG: hypothetical protein M0024_14635 [Nitrospiraceae bacterium]|nr:hypothetical protein [Nitrospiraceae bacterium]
MTRIVGIVIILLTVMFLSGAEGARKIPKSFSYLKQLDVGAAVGEGRGYTIIYYNAKISKALKYSIEFSDEAGASVRAIETKIDSTTHDVYVIDYNAGPSGDPKFIIYRKIDHALKKLASIPGDNLIIPGDGNVYVSGESDDFFDRRRKYVLSEGTLKEVPQPYYYVGLRTRNVKPLNIYSDRDYQIKVTHLPAGSEIEVLVASLRKQFEYDFLIKSPYGLTGWVTVEGQDGMCGTESIKGICFHGD